MSGCGAPWTTIQRSKIRQYTQAEKAAICNESQRDAGRVRFSRERPSPATDGATVLAGQHDIQKNKKPMLNSEASVGVDSLCFSPSAPFSPRPSPSPHSRGVDSTRAMTTVSLSAAAPPASRERPQCCDVLKRQQPQRAINPPKSQHVSGHDNEPGSLRVTASPLKRASAVSRLVFLPVLVTPSDQLATEPKVVVDATPYLLRQRRGIPFPRGEIQATTSRRIMPTPIKTPLRAASNTIIGTAPVIPNVVSYDNEASGHRGRLPRPPHGRHLRSSASAAAGRTLDVAPAASPPPAFDQTEDADFQLALDLLSRPPTPEGASTPRLLAIPFSPLLHMNMGGDVPPEADRSKPPRLTPPRSHPVGQPAPIGKRAMPPGQSPRSSRGSSHVEPKAAKKQKVGARRQPREDGCSRCRRGEGKGREEKAAAAAAGGHGDNKRRRFNREEEVALLRGLVKHGRGKWKVIYDDEPLLNRSIQASALKDRVRSKRFAVLLKRAEADPTLLDRPDELCGSADQEVYDLLSQGAGSGCETSASMTKKGARRPLSRRAEHRGRAGKTPPANVSYIPPSLDSPPQSHGVMVRGARTPSRGEVRAVEEVTVTLRAEV